MTNGRIDDFCAWVQSNIPEERPRNLQPQANWITDNNQQILVDFIGRFEHLEEDLKTLSKRADMPCPALRHLNTSKEKVNYRDLYDEHTIELASKYYKSDAEIFKYSF